MRHILSFLVMCLLSFSAMAAGGSIDLPEQKWSFEGTLGSFDRASAQRGFQVYKEVCAACHGLKLVNYRNLSILGFNEAEIKAIAAEYTVIDGPNDEGEMFERPARPADKFVSPFANEQAARSANGGAYPPDLSLMIEARPNGANYVYALLTGYTDAPKGTELMAGMSYNKYFPGHQIAMASPLSDDAVEYADGTSATVEQMSKDVVTFLAWAAEPNLEERKKMGLKVLIFLAFFTLIFYLIKKSIWKDVQ